MDLGELCWLQFFKTVYLETSNVRFGSFFQNPVTYNVYMVGFEAQCLLKELVPDPGHMIVALHACVREG